MLTAFSLGFALTLFYDGSAKERDEKDVSHSRRARAAQFAKLGGSILKTALAGSVSISRLLLAHRRASSFDEHAAFHGQPGINASGCE
jgi:hypothetical protein